MKNESGVTLENVCGQLWTESVENVSFGRESEDPLTATVMARVTSQMPSTHCSLVGAPKTDLSRFSAIPPRLQEQIKRTASGHQGNGSGWPPYASPAAVGVRYRRSGEQTAISSICILHIVPQIDFLRNTMCVSSLAICYNLIFYPQLFRST